MRKLLRTVVIVVLSVGLLALFLRGANLSVVWTEMKQADSWLIAFSAVVTIRDHGAARDSVAVPARADRACPLRSGVPHDDHRLRGERRPAGARGRGDPSVPARAAGGPERHRDVRDHHHRATAGRGDLRHAARVVRPVLRSRHGPRRQHAVQACWKSAVWWSVPSRFSCWV